METHECSFCKIKIEPGTGVMFVKRDGSLFYLCSSKCEKNMLKLSRTPRKMRWITSRQTEKVKIEPEKIKEKAPKEVKIKTKLEAGKKKR